MLGPLTLLYLTPLLNLPLLSPSSLLNLSLLNLARLSLLAAEIRLAGATPVVSRIAFLRCVFLFLDIAAFFAVFTGTALSTGEIRRAEKQSHPDKNGQCPILNFYKLHKTPLKSIVP